MEDVLWYILCPTDVIHCVLFCYWHLLLASQGCRGQCLTRHHNCHDFRGSDAFPVVAGDVVGRG
jgi:hypothetical protein